MSTAPRIIVSERDAERLEALLARLSAEAAPAKAALEAELERADVVAPEAVPPNVVTMNSKIRFRVASTGDEITLRLVYPKDVDDSGGTISVLAPVGSALLGLTQGDRIEWPKPGGGTLEVELVEILYQPERAGEYHR